MRLLSYNIRFGGDGRERLLAGVINACAPDVVVLEEATHEAVVKRLAGLCGMKQFASQQGQSVAFMSRIDVAQYRWHDIRLGKRRYLELFLPGPGLRVFGVHLSAVHSNITERRRVIEIRALLHSVRAHEKSFHLLTGDFNTLAPGEHLDLGKLPFRLRAFVWMTGRNIRWQTIQLMLNAAYADAYRIFHKDDEGYTFPTWDPHVRLDYTFLPALYAPRVTECSVVRDAPGVRDASDHFPLLTVIGDGPV